MRDILANASAWLEKTRTKFATCRVVYRRGASSCNIPATRGKTDFQSNQADGMVTDFTIRDYLVNVCDLTLDDVLIEPRRGDQIVEIREGGRIYEVTAAPDGREWMHSDLYHKVYRIHTNYRGKIEAPY